MSDIFEDLSASQRNKLFHLLEAHTYSFLKNQEILPTLKHNNIIGIILSGDAQIINIEYNGEETIIEKLHENDVFGSSLSSINSDNYQIIAKEDTEVLVIDYNKIVNTKNITHTYFNIFQRNLFEIFNSKMKEKSERIRVLEQKQIRDRLLEYFDIEYRKTYLRRIVLPFTLKELADYIAVNRSAMFRELKHLKEEGFIEVKGRKITLLYK